MLYLFLLVQFNNTDALDGYANIGHELLEQVSLRRPWLEHLLQLRCLLSLATFEHEMIVTISHVRGVPHGHRSKMLMRLLVASARVVCSWGYHVPSNKQDVLHE